MATVIAACIVPILGFVGFRYQKYLDRGASALEVRRKEYAEYVRLAHDYVEKTAKEDSAELWPLSRQADILFIVGNGSVAAKVSDHLMAARYFGRVPDDDDGEIYDAMRRGVDNQLNALITEMRKDLEDDSSFAPPSDKASESKAPNTPLTYRTQPLKIVEEEST
jgi:hypothetical protein